LAFWVAEGYASNREIIFDFGINEEKYVKEIGKISNKIFLSTNVRIDKKKNKQRVVIGSQILYHLFKGMGLKTGAKRKEIPFFVFNLDRNLKLEFLKSLYQGGGCFVKEEELSFILQSVKT
jgi:intein/homing endonuclease